MSSVLKKTIFNIFLLIHNFGNLFCFYIIKIYDVEWINFMIKLKLF
jgi:hypothetical protein